MVPRNKGILLLLKILLSATLLYVVLSKTGINQIVSTLGNISMPFFFAAVAMYLLSLFISSIRWSLFVPAGLKQGRIFSLYLIGSFFNHLLPGLIGGDAVKAYYLYKDTGNSTSAIASVFMDRYVGFSALMSVGLVAFPFGLPYFRGTYIVWLLPVIVLLFMTGSFAVFVLRIGRRTTLLSGFYDYFSLFRDKKGILLKSYLLSALIQIIIICAVYIVSRGLMVQVPLTLFFVFIPIITTIATIPVSFSGLGVREASFVLLFGSLGIDPVRATAISFAWFLSIALGSLPGLIEYLKYRVTPATPQ